MNGKLFWALSREKGKNVENKQKNEWGKKKKKKICNASKNPDGCLLDGDCGDLTNKGKNEAAEPFGKL